MEAAPRSLGQRRQVAGVDVPDAMEPEVVHTITFDIAAIVEEISTRIHSPKPVASEMPHLSRGHGKSECGRWPKMIRN